MTEKRELYLVEHARSLPDNGRVVELLTGEFVFRETPDPIHEKLVGRLLESLSIHVDESDLGAVFRSPWPVELSKFDLVRPDVYFVAWKDGVIGVDGVRGTPELVIEVLSPESRDRDLGEKKRLYSWAKVFEYWVVDPAAGTVTQMTKQTQGYKEIPVEGTRLRSFVLPDFELDLSKLFSDQ